MRLIHCIKKALVLLCVGGIESPNYRIYHAFETLHQKSVGLYYVFALPAALNAAAEIIRHQRLDVLVYPEVRAGREEKKAKRSCPRGTQPQRSFGVRSERRHALMRAVLRSTSAAGTMRRGRCRCADVCA